MNSLLLVLIASTPTVPVHVEGEGWMRFSREGRTVFAREANLTVVKGRLAAGSAFVLPTIPLGEGAEFKIGRDGTVTTNGKVVGRITLALFGSSAPSTQSGEFWISASRGTVVNAGESGSGWFATESVGIPVAKPVPQAKPSNQSPTNSSVQIRVHPESTVEGKTFSLAEIADLQLPAELKSAIGRVVVGDTPPIGLDRKLDRDRLYVRLRVAGFDPNAFSIDMPSEVIVRRPSQRVEHARFVETALATLKTQVGDQAEIVDLNPLPPLVLALGEVTLTALTPSLSNNRAVIRVEVRLNGVVANSRTLQFSVAGRIPLPKIGTMVTVRAKSGGVKVQFPAKVTATSGLNQIEVITAEGTKIVGILAEPGVVEITL